ncbi:zf-RVT domain-containing protein, partial [Cephalotus follicularis]
DRLVWSPSSDGIFTCKSAYLLQADNKESRYSSLSFKCLWSLYVLPHNKSFLWLAAIDRMSSRNLLKAQSIIKEDECPECNSQLESVLHVLRDCHHSKRI